MPLTLPNLDDRRWADLVDEARALIPVYGPDWTDHNVHDPGIMLMELFAWIAETDIYRLNQIPERHRRKFLKLVGVQPCPARPATTVVRVALETTATAFVLPAGFELEGADASGRTVRFRTRDKASLVPGQLQAIQAGDAMRLQDLTGRWQRGEQIEMFGVDAVTDSSLYFGFSAPPPADVALTLAFTVADFAESSVERQALLDDAIARAEACRAPRSLVSCGDAVDCGHASGLPRLSHHSVRIVWEYLAAPGQWRAVPAGQVIDDTRAFTLNGTVQIQSPSSLTKSRLGQVSDELYYLRCRLADGAYETPPRLLDVSMNGIAVEQAYGAGFLSWTIAADAIVEGDVPAIGTLVGFQLRVNAKRQITHVTFAADAQPRFYVLDYKSPAPDAPGLLAIAAEDIGAGSGEPSQQCRLSSAPILTAGLAVFTEEDGVWHEWSSQVDLDASRASDGHFVADSESGVITFGDGAHGRVPPAGATIVAVYDATAGEAGNVARNRIDRLVDSPRNRALAATASLGSAQSVADRVALIANPLAAAGGAEAETVLDAEARALDLASRGCQVVTTADCEAFALQVPGTRVARAFARPNLHPSFPCVTAPGMMTLLIVPELPRHRPVPSDGLRRVVAAALAARRVIGTRIEVVGPVYTEIAIHATVHPLPGVNVADLQVRLNSTLDDFLDPLHGGPDGTGWPFGRDVYRSEILHVLDRTAGVDYVTDVAIGRDGADPQCGNVCLGPDGLTTPGTHVIEIAGGGSCQGKDRSR